MRIAIKAGECGRMAIGNGVEMGVTLVAFSRIWRFAAETVADGRVLPALSDGKALWQPEPNACNELRLRRFCEGAPRGCVALRGARPLHEFYEWAVDAQMRLFGPDPFNAEMRKYGRGNLHSQFLCALTREDPSMDWDDPGDLSRLAERLAAWRSRIARPADGGPRIAFRILDPRGGRERPLWTLLPVIEAGGEIQKISPATLRALGREGELRILHELGKAAGIAKDLADGPIDIPGTGGAVSLDAASLNSFMNDTVPKLADSGYHVFAPRWWRPLAARRISLRARSVGGGHRLGDISLDSILDVKWEVVLDGTGVTERELRWIAENDGPIVHTDHGWMNVDRRLVSRAANLLKEMESRKIPVRELVRIGLGFASSGEIGLEVSSDAMPRDVRAAIRRLSGRGRLERVPVPRGFNGTLRPYQRKGLDWLSFLRGMGFGACLADDMGLGKTVEAIAAFLDARASGDQRPMLVVCPMSIMLKWSHEARRFAPSLSVWICHGPDRPSGKGFSSAVASHDLCITSYHTLGQDYDSFSSVKWGIVALDEAQNVKNPETLKSKSARGLDAGWRLAITGTPVENSIGDLWAIMDFLNRGLLPPRGEFDRRFRLNGSASPLDGLRKIVAPFILRRVKTDPEIAAGLPPKVEERVYCRLSREQAAAYAAEMAAAEGTLAGRTGISRRGAVLALITRLKQICDYPPLAQNSGEDALDPAVSGKLERLDDMLARAIANGESSLVFTQYAQFGKRLAEHLSKRFGFNVPLLHGAVPPERRAEMVGDFQSDSGPRIMLLSIRAGGTGLDLTRATHVFHYDRWWNPAVENQATDRAHRIGQSKTVFVHTFICDGTLESKIDDLIASKVRLAEGLVPTGSGWLADLDDSRLREVLSLSE